MKKRFKVSLLFILSFLVIVSCNIRHVAEKPDSTIPTILSTDPASNATAVVVNSVIRVTSSKAMNETSINNTSFLLMSAMTGTIAGTVTYDPASNVATFTPVRVFGSSGNGMVITDDLNQRVETAAGLAVQADGKIIVAATFHPSAGLISTEDFALFPL